MSAIRIPNRWDPRPYQQKLWNALEGGCKRAVAVWHRRSGKDDVALHWACTQALQRPGTYWHLLPQSNQARKAIWDAVDPHTGLRRIDWAFPKELRETTREQDMLIKFKGTGSTWQVVGSDNYNALVGSPPAGIVYSEFMLSDPNAWSFMRPILLENGGWALFNGTPRGRNHLHGIYKLGQHEPGWFSEILTVAQTGVLTPEQIEKERREIARERGDDEAANIIAQEYFCSWDAAIPGSYYGKIMAKLEEAGRITDVPHDPRYPVITAWDLGVGDSTAVWFLQEIGLEVHVIDYYEQSGVGADHYARILKERDYNYEGHYLPHDANDREWGNNASSRVDTLKSLGVKPIRVQRRASVDDGINAVRVLLPRCRFDRSRCDRGIETLRQYQRTWDDQLKCFSQKPLHDWTSHGADALRCYAQGARDVARRQYPKPEYATM